MDYSFILQQIQNILTENRMSLLPIIFIGLSLLIFLISRAFRKSGLFVLVIAFGIDYTIKSLPFDLYNNIPGLYNAITILYIIGFIIFFLKVLKMLMRSIKSTNRESLNTDSKIKDFFRFTGMLPFMIMLIINILDFKNILPKNILNLLTSLSFLYMVFRTSLQTYKYLGTKESVVLSDKMNFDEIKDFLKNDNKKSKNISNSKNTDRKILKRDKINKEDITQTVNIESTTTNTKIKLSDIKYTDEKKYNLDNDIKTYNTKKDHTLSNTDLISLVTGDFEKPINTTTLSITDLKTGQRISYTSQNAIFNIHENDEYKVDLEFRTNNEYDYGRFIDILLRYSKNKEDYKFELVISPHNRNESKVVLYDPSNIFDVDEADYVNVGGRIISMNFPKYKINFITGN